MTALRSALYAGHLVHVRHTPVPHRFRYPVRFFLFDLAELPVLSRRLLLLSRNRPGLLALYDEDYGEAGQRIEEGVQSTLRARGIDLTGGRVLLLTQVRVVGYVFNPVSFFYCYDAGGELRAVLAEINNTWGERHRYALDAAGRIPSRRGARFEQAKTFRVSPFISLDATYRFHFLQERPDESPGAPLDVHMDVLDATGRPFFFASLHGERRPLTDGALAASLVRYPFMTLQIIGFIHLEALRLFWKGVPNVRPAPPEVVALRARSAAGPEPGRPLEARPVGDPVP